MSKNIVKFKGIIPPIVTPLVNRETLDEPGLERLVNHLLAGGVHGIFALGTTGEAPSLDVNLKRKMVERVCQCVDGKVPVLVCITDTSFTESVKLAEHAADFGATALVLAPPYYFPAGQPELLEYIEHLAGKLPLPLMLYNMPAMTKVNLEPETVVKALEIPGIVGMKDSSGDMLYFHKIRQLLGKKADEVSLFIGSEGLLAEAVLFGADGGVTGGANVFPSLYVQLYEAARRQDFKKAIDLHGKVMRVGQLLYGVGRYSSSSIKGIKCALSYLNVCNDSMAEPFAKFNAPERALIAKAVDQLQQELAE